MVTFGQVKADPNIDAYIKAGNDALGVLGYTEHGLAHAGRVSHTAATVLKRYGGAEREVELARIAGYVHDIGNMVNRENHAQSGALLAFQILSQMGMEPIELVEVVSAIGNHDEGAGVPVNRVGAALILADKADVRRSRVRRPRAARLTDDIHDRVNYAVTHSELILPENEDIISLKLVIDTQICPVIEYFKIFTVRMFMCKSACELLGAKFSLVINETVLM